MSLPSILIDHVLGAPAELDLGGGWTLDWASLAGRSLAALTCVLAQTGFRKSEVTVQSRTESLHHTVKRSSLTWLIRGVPTSEPTPAQLRDLADGDFAIITPPPSKSDPFDMVWGGNPIWLPFIDGEPLCAAAALAALELDRPASAAADTALFTDDAGRPFVAAQLAEALKRMLLVAYEPATVTLYSWHSARIYLCTSLLEAGASRAQIQALCRWQTEESINVYGRFTKESYGTLLRQALAVDVSTARAHNLLHAAPFVSAKDVAIVRATELVAAEDDLDNVDPGDDADDPQ